MDWEKGRIHQTLDGAYVRSKSEVVIYNILLNSQVPFEYERSIEIEGGKTLSPDFYFEISSEECVIWEHFGLMAKKKYRRRAEEKLKLYRRHGFVRGINFFVTYDDPSGGIDSNGIARLASFIAKKIAGKIDFNKPYATEILSAEEPLYDLTQELRSIQDELETIDREDQLQEERRALSQEIKKEKSKLQEKQRIFAEATKKNMTIHQYESFLEGIRNQEYQSYLETLDEKKRTAAERIRMLNQSQERHNERLRALEQHRPAHPASDQTNSINAETAGVEHTFRVFYEVYKHLDDLPDAPPGDSPISMNIADIYLEIFLMLDEAGEFLGIIDQADTTLQLALEPSGLYHTEVLCPEKGGYYGKDLTFDEIAEIITSLRDAIPSEGYAGFTFSSW